MKIFDIPFLIEILFVICTIVFVVTLSALLPAVLENKRTFFKPLFVWQYWKRYLRLTFREAFKKNDLLKLNLTQHKIQEIARLKIMNKGYTNTNL